MMSNLEDRYEIQIYRNEYDRLNGEVSEYEYCNTIEKSIEESEEWISISACVEVIDTQTNEAILNFSREDIDRVYYMDELKLEEIKS